MAEPRSLQVRYRRYRPSVPVARAKARALAREWGLLLDVADSLEWVVTELVTNAVIHGRATRGSRVVVAYHLDGERLRVEVRDAASGMPRVGSSVSEDGDAPEGGRGLQIVATLADDWGVTPRVIGKSVWVELALSSKEGGQHEQ
ncbi:ATP-binding protein [Streptomyces sp. NPDC046685]|uniref:ATP-binding protein n=1 Tax=Streptomyces sp. NPDC046685 TaxID=3157202 RepID=UPI0033CD23D4